MRTWMAGLIVAGMVAVVPVSMNAESASLKKKPQSPVRITLQLADDRLDPASIKPGDEVAMKVVITSSLGDQEMHITVSMTEGVQLVSGDLSWRGPSVKGAITVLPLVVRVPMDGKGKVRALVEIGPRRAGHISSRAVYEFGASKIQRSQSAGKPRKDSKGRGVVEYK